MPESPSDHGATSLSMLERARNQDTDAWRRLVELYSPLVFFWARRAGLAHADAADLVQEVWQSVASALSRFRSDERTGTFRGWLWTIARHKLIDHVRKRGAEPAAAGGTDARKFIETLPEQEAVDESGVQENQLLHRALARIKPEFEERTWQAFWRMTVDGQMAANVGQELGLAANAVHQPKFRVLSRLRAEKGHGGSANRGDQGGFPSRPLLSGLVVSLTRIIGRGFHSEYELLLVVDLPIELQRLFPCQ